MDPFGRRACRERHHSHSHSARARRNIMTAYPAPGHEAAVVIGRFQPFHNAHRALIHQALAAAPLVVAVIGSACQARSPKNPFSWEERAQMIRLSLSPSERERVLFVPVRDHFDEARWFAELRQSVDAVLARRGVAPSSSRALIGHAKDATRDYLGGFGGWTLHSAARVHTAGARTVRDRLFGATPHTADAVADALADSVPHGTIEFLRSWVAQPRFGTLVAEWTAMKQYEASWAAAPYPPVLVTVDCVVKCRDRVLLIRRGQAPGKGLYAVPGGFLEQRETTQQAALRELEEETHLDLPSAELRACLAAAEVFDHPDRSQRGRTITHGYFFDLGDRELPQVRADDDAEAVEWTPIAAICAREDQFLDDHFQMLEHFLGLQPALLIA